MGFTVPNSPDAAVVDQAEPDALDYQALGHHSTGVQYGCEVSAQFTPNMSVNVGAGVAVVDGEPVEVAQGTLSIQTSSTQPRFDIVVVDAGGAKSVVRGTTSGTNPVFPDVDVSVYATLAAIYVAASTSSITLAACVDKRVHLAEENKRIYTDPDRIVQSTQSPSGVVTTTAGGKISWVESTFQRLSVSVMELVSSLVLRSTDSIAALLTLQARPTNPATQKALNVVSAGGASVASISGTGLLQAANFVSGVGSPLGVVVGAAKGTIYIDTNTPRNRTLWVSEGGNEWAPFRGYDPSDEEIPVGTVAPYLGEAGAEPLGWLPVEGQLISTTDAATTQLAQLVGNRHGEAPGSVRLPDLRGRILTGQGGDLGLSLGESLGTLTTTLETANLPAHGHAVTDSGHRHPSAGRRVFAPPVGNLFPTTTDGDTPFALVADPDEFNTTSKTGITIDATGTGEAFSTLPPVSGVNWIVKAHVTYARLSAIDLAGVVKLEDNGITVYASIADISAAVALGEGVVSDADLVAAFDDKRIDDDGRFATDVHVHPGDPGGGPVPAVTTVNGFAGVVVLAPSDVGAATAAQGALAASAVQPGDLGTAAAESIGAFDAAGAAAAAQSASQPADANLTTLAGAGNTAALALTDAVFTTAKESKLDGLDAATFVPQVSGIGMRARGFGPTEPNTDLQAGDFFFLQA
jgi:microcystin-dependent protein